MRLRVLAGSGRCRLAREASGLTLNIQFLCTGSLRHGMDREHNVGGNKAQPEEVELCLREVAGKVDRVTR